MPSGHREGVPRPCACTSVRRAARVLVRVFDAALAASGMNITQLAVMRAVLRHRSEPLTRVAEDLAMDRTTLYRALATLQKQKWVRLTDGADGRTRTALVTKSGRRVLAKTDPSWGSAQQAIIDRFGRTQWQIFAAELQRLSDCAAAVSV
jgi:DNA-binding MarR family transcriptional regulator